MTVVKILYWECPFCKRRISDLEYTAARYDYDCAGSSPFNKDLPCGNLLSDYKIVLDRAEDEQDND